MTGVVQLLIDFNYVNANDMSAEAFCHAKVFFWVMNLSEVGKLLLGRLD